MGFTPDYVVYHELVMTVKEYMQCVTAVDGILKDLCLFHVYMIMFICLYDLYYKPIKTVLAVIDVSFGALACRTLISHVSNS